MFSHTINNPNNFIIINESITIPFGHRCTSALACKYANLRNFSLPFDWTHPTFPKKIQNVLENNFTQFIPDVYDSIFCNIYDINLAHFNNNLKDGVEEYKRRIIRFLDIINQPKKIYFVYINEDYLYDNNYRDDTFNNNIFSEMIALENFLKLKYKHIDYNILYFNFKNHEIPSDSNMINIVLHTTTLFDQEKDAPFEIFRNYCGKILSELFNTNLSFGYNENTFNN